MQGRGRTNEGRESRDRSALHTAPGAQHRCLYVDEEASRCPVLSPHAAYLGVIGSRHLFQQDAERLQVEADVLGFLQP